MLYFPFIYFTTLLLAVIRKRGFDMSAYMIFIYAISSFGSVSLSVSGAGLSESLDVQI